MRRVAGAVVLLVLLGCGSGPAPTPLIVYVTPPPTVAASPTPAGARILVAGTTVCDFTSDITTERPTTDLAVYSATMACVYEASDPRVSGSDSFELTETEYAKSGQDINWFRCTNQVLTTAGGIWRGECFGSEFVIPATDGLWTSGYSILNGEGAYDGLVLHLLYAQSPWDGGGEHYVIAGWIEPAD